MTSISDPARARRGDKRKAQKAIDAAYAGGELTAAERSMRIQQIDAAQSRGDLAMILRDLGGPGDAGTPTAAQTVPESPSLGSALDPAMLASMRVGKAGGTSWSSPAGATINVAGLAHRVKVILIIGAVAIVGLCGLSVAAFIPAVMDSRSSESSGTTVTTGEPRAESPTSVSPSSDLHSAAGWRDLVAAIKAESGSTLVYDLVVYPEYASVGLDGGNAVDRRLYRSGAWQGGFNVRTPAVGGLTDVGQIDATVIERLPGETARSLGVDAPTGTYLIVNAVLGSGRILVYVQSDTAGAQYRAYDLNGNPLQSER